MEDITSVKNKLSCAYCAKNITNEKWTYYGKRKVCLECKRILQNKKGEKGNGSNK